MTENTAPVSGDASVAADPPSAATPHDPVNSPSHYTAHPNGVECIVLTEAMGFCDGNAVKYLWRAGLKGDRLEDLRKARWYAIRAQSTNSRTCDPGLVDMDKSWVQEIITVFPARIASAMWHLIAREYVLAIHAIDEIIAEADGARHD